MKKSWMPGLGYLALVFIAAFITGHFYQIQNLGRAFLCVSGLIALIVIAFAATAFYGFYKNKKWNFAGAIPAVLAVSFLLRAYYIIYTPTWVRQHDVIGFGAGFGQAAFIEYFYEKIRLIDFDPRDYWGFFQPPLHHMLAGLWLRLQVAIGYTYNHACENVQVLTLIYASVLTYFGLRILKQCKVEGEALVFSTMLIALHPSYVIMSGSINNDILCTLLSVMTIYYFLRYLETESWKDIILTAFALGFSMMAKLSGILLAPAIGVLLLVRFVDAIRSKDFVRVKNYLLRYLVFGACSIPIGIWSPLRNFVKFGVPLNFTPEVGEPLTGHGVLARIFDIRTDTPFTRMISSGHEFDEFNVPLAFLKTAFFGEYTFADTSKYATFFGWIILLSGAVLTVWAGYEIAVDIICVTILCRNESAVVNPADNTVETAVNPAENTVKTAVNTMENKAKIEVETAWFWGILTITAIAFYVNLCFSIPNFSSQDFRYISFLVIVQAVMLGKRMMKKSLVGKRILEGIILAFALSTTGLYLLVGRVAW